MTWIPVLSVFKQRFAESDHRAPHARPETVRRWTRLASRPYRARRSDARGGRCRGRCWRAARRWPCRRRGGSDGGLRVAHLQQAVLLRENALLLDELALARRQRGFAR